MKKIIPLIFFFVFCACSESGSIMSSAYQDTTNNTTTTTNATLVPGITFSVKDMYKSYSSLVVVLVNNQASSTPSFYIDYEAHCGSGQKNYGNIYLSFGSYEQTSRTIYVGSSSVNSCSLTITTIRSVSSGFIPWNGTYTVTTSMYH